MTLISELGPTHAHLPTRLPIGPTIGLAFRVFGRSPGKFIGLMLISVMISTIFGLLGALAAGETWAVVAIIAVRICKIAVQLLVGGAFVVAINDIVTRGRFDFDESLILGFRRIGALLALGLLQFLIVILATLLLVVPGIIAGVFFCVAVPACVLEGLGATASLARSRSLTRGNRWRIFALAMVVLVAILAAAVVVGIAIRAHLLIVAIPVALAIFGPALIVVVMLPTVLYLQLRGIEDGSGPVALPSALD